MPLLAVLFDLDDTLHDKSATLEHVARVQFTAFNLSSLGVTQAIWQERFLTLNNQRIEKAQVFKCLAAEFALPSALQRAMLEDFDQNLGKHARPYAGALEVLTMLKKNGLKLGIVTNGRDAFQRSKLDGMGITGVVDSIVTSGGFGVKKPDPRIFAACLSELQIAAGSAAFVGDDFAADIEPAIALGMFTVWKSSNHSDRANFCSNELTHVGDILLSRK